MAIQQLLQSISSRSRRFLSRARRISLVLALALGWSLSLGWGLSQVGGAQEAERAIAATPPANTVEIGTVDVVPTQLQLGQRLYFQNCSGCHFAPPPEVMPLQSWAAILQTPQHYGTVITPLQDPARRIMWNYVRASSRSIVQNETVPSRFAQSRYMRALHPGVELPEPLSFGSCISCHPAAIDFNFRRLSPEWQARE
ncbi:MAG TPA: diheme cytochrome C [Thermoleptolyngbya sp. M55_K2018_002]|nr:diheme cytochrome C [Thermoleptolyngbya sp. M55_K2018_002]